MINKVIMPKLGETMEEGEIIQWLKHEGDRVKEGEPLLEIATDKANMEVEALSSGFLREIVAPAGEIVSVTKTIAYIADSMQEEISQEAEASEKPAQKKVPEKPPIQPPIKASPLAKKLARDYGIDLSTVKGSGPGGRVLKEDVIKLAEEKEAVAEKAVSLSRIEKVMVQRMEKSKREIPHFYLTVEVDFSKSQALRDDLLKEFEEREKVRVSYTDLLVKSCGRALSKFPRVNSTFEAGRITSHSEFNVGRAVATPKGLIVPVIKDVDKKNLFQIARKRKELVKKANEDRLSLEELEGAAFTLSNLGMFGIKTFIAIINPPQASLLATGEIKERPVVIDNRIEIRPMMEMTLSCDHRVMDGYLGAKFLQEIKRGLERPSLLLIEIASLRSR
ncbi:MAG: 2-oxo acid dehydrogenase subunit E2 [Candidatus Aerophobus sp.]|nr:MAG: 2-oxo acid dehydrogenase subunit E2 [Candidatus Aerophobus sp.]